MQKCRGENAQIAAQSAIQFKNQGLNYLKTAVIAPATAPILFEPGSWVWFSTPALVCPSCLSKLHQFRGVKITRKACRRSNVIDPRKPISLILSPEHLLRIGRQESRRWPVNSGPPSRCKR